MNDHATKCKSSKIFSAVDGIDEQQLGFWISQTKDAAGD